MKRTWGAVVAAKLAVAAVAVCLPSSANAECVAPNEAEMSEVRESLKIDESARFTDVCKSARSLQRNGPSPVYCGLVNAKNSSGAHVGFRQFFSFPGKLAVFDAVGAVPRVLPRVHGT